MGGKQEMGKADNKDARGWGARRIGMGAGAGAVRDSSGQSLVELALILPVFVLLILGAVEFGQLAYAAIEVSNAARAGVQYGAQSGATAADIGGMESAAINDGSNVSGLSATATEFCSCSNAASTPVACSTAATACPANGARALTYVQVDTTATVTPMVHYPGLSSGFTLNGQAIMRVE
jgi:Flp pilus assembly protein TadG